MPLSMTAHSWSRWLSGLPLTSLDGYLFICWESMVAWRVYVTHPCMYSLCQVGIRVINASFDSCWKVSLKHERTSKASIITHSVMLPRLPTHVSTLYGLISYELQRWFFLAFANEYKDNVKSKVCPLYLNRNVCNIYSLPPPLLLRGYPSFPNSSRTVVGRTIYLAACFVMLNRHSLQVQMFTLGGNKQQICQNVYLGTPCVPQCST